MGLLCDPFNIPVCVFTHLPKKHLKNDQKNCICWDCINSFVCLVPEIFLIRKNGSEKKGKKTKTDGLKMMTVWAGESIKASVCFSLITICVGLQPHKEERRIWKELESLKTWRVSEAAAKATFWKGRELSVGLKADAPHMCLSALRGGIQTWTRCTLPSVTLQCIESFSIHSCLIQKEPESRTDWPEGEVDCIWGRDVCTNLWSVWHWWQSAVYCWENDSFFDFCSSVYWHEFQLECFFYFELL